MAEGVWQEWVKKEYVTTMRSKGKIDCPTSIAKERKDFEMNHTMGRVFPGREVPRDPIGHGPAAKPSSKVNREQLKAQIVQMEEEFAKEKAARTKLEQEFSEAIH